MTYGIVGFLGRAPAGGGAAPTGYSQVNSATLDGRKGQELNVLDTGNLVNFGGGATPLQIDDNCIPKATLTAGQYVVTSITFNDHQFNTGIPWVFKWTPAGAAVVQFPGLPFGTPTLIQNCSYGSGTITIAAGQAARVEFTPTGPAPSPTNLYFLAAAYAPTSNKPVMCRISDEAAIAGGQYWTPEFLSSLSGLNLKTIRFMSWVLYPDLGNADNLSAWSYRGTTSMISLYAEKFFPGLYAGDTTGTDFYTISRPTGLPAADWVDGEAVQANVVNASTRQHTISGAVSGTGGVVRLTVSTTTGMSTNQKIYVSDVHGTLEALGVQTITVVDGTHIELQGTPFVNAYTGGGVISVQTMTVTGKTNPTKITVYYNGTANTTIPTGMTTFVYNAGWDVLLWKDGGLVHGHPIEMMVDLCNRLRVNMWYTFPMLATDGFVTSLTALVRDTLSPGLSLYLEYSNETWNGSFPGSQYTGRKGDFLGIGNYWGFTGLRAAMIFQLAKPIWTATGRSAASLRRCIMWQGYGDNNVKVYTLEGALLNPAGNARLTAYLGGSPPNYSALGLRPVDLADVVGYANYSSGAVIKNFGYSWAPFNTPYVVSTLQAMATAFNSNPNDPTSLAIIDDDFRQGVYGKITIQSVSGTTINATANTTELNQEVVFYNSGGSLPTPLVTGKIYFVVSPATNTFSVSLTRGGAAISLSGGSGTHSIGKVDLPSVGPTPQTLLQHSTSIFRNVVSAQFSPGWEGVIASYDAYRTGAGLPLLRVELYEGGLEGNMPSASECTSMGITVGGSGATAAAALAAGLNAWKNSSYGSAFSLAVYNQFMGTDAACVNTFGLMPHSQTPSWLAVPGPSIWGLYPSEIGSTPYQTYNGIASFVGKLN